MSDTSNLPATEAHHKLNFNIIVNGTAEIWHHPRMSYEQAIHLAFPDGQTGGDIRYSVVWMKPDGQEGSLRPGRHEHVVEGMRFDVRNTDKS